jgi:hypothetical protein
MLVAFDLLRLNRDDLRLRPLEARREALRRLVDGVDGIMFSEALAAEGAVGQEPEFRQDMTAMRDVKVSLTGAGASASAGGLTARLRTGFAFNHLRVAVNAAHDAHRTQSANQRNQAVGRSWAISTL